MTVAWLRGAALYLPLAWLAPADAHGHDGHYSPCAGFRPSAGLPLSLFVGVHDRAAIRQLGDEALPAIEVPPASHAERLAAWQRAVPSAAHRPVLAELARRFRCETTAIERIGAELSLLGRAPTADELLAAARADLDLGALAQAGDAALRPRRADAAAGADPPGRRDRDGDAQPRRVHYEWGTARAWNEGGLAALFAGPPGTGKTMAGEAIAHELELPLFRIDLSQVVNKYIGETEKNLKRLFDAADAGRRDPVLRRGRRAVRQAHRGQGRARPLRQPRGQLPARAHGALQGPGDPGHQPHARTSTKPSCAGCASSSSSRCPASPSACASGAASIPEGVDAGGLDFDVPRRSVPARRRPHPRRSCSTPACRAARRAARRGADDGAVIVAR